MSSILQGTMATMAWPEIHEHAKRGAIVLWPTSVLEEHGPHMTIGVDIYLAYEVARAAQDRLLMEGIPTVLAPPNYWGINNVTAAFPGSFSLRQATLKALIYDTLASLKRWGFERVFLVDLHGDVSHRGPVVEAVAEARVGSGTRAMMIIPYRYARYAGMSGQESHVLIQPPGVNEANIKAFTTEQDYHAGSFETSFMARYYPEQVDEEQAAGLPPTRFAASDWRKWASGWSDAQEVIPKGYNGDPATLKPDLAEAFVKEEADSISDLIAAHLQGRYRPPDLEDRPKPPHPPKLDVIQEPL